MISIQKTNSLLICPYCKKSIPSLLLLPFEGKMDLEVQCPCLKKKIIISLHQFIEDLSSLQQEAHQCTKHPNAEGQYCVKCMLWLCRECKTPHLELGSDHVLCNQEVLIKCSQHLEPFSHYCDKCRKDICDECLESHKNHYLRTLSKIQRKRPLMYIFEEIKKNNRDHVKAFVDMKKASDQMKEDIEFACVVNENINEDLKVLYQCIINTAFAFKDYRSSGLMSLQTISFNLQQFNKEERHTYEKYYALKHYLNTNYALIQEYANSCIVTIKNSESPICLIQLKDGRMVAGFNNNAIKFWETTTFQLLATLTGHFNFVTCLIQLNDGRLASGSYDDTVKLWDTETNNKCLATFIGHSHWVNCLCQLKDGRLASGSYDNTIKLWNATAQKCKATLRGHTNWVNALCPLNDGQLASCSEQNIKLWDVTSRKCLFTLTEHSGNVLCLIQLTDGRLASGSGDKTIKLWDTTKRECICTLTGHTSSIHRMISLENGRLALVGAGSNEKAIRLWDITVNKSVVLSDHQREISCLFQFFDGRLASCSYDSTIKIWKIN